MLAFLHTGGSKKKKSMNPPETASYKISKSVPTTIFWKAFDLAQDNSSQAANASDSRAVIAEIALSLHQPPYKSRA